jgi:hypothetical protein
MSAPPVIVDLPLDRITALEMDPGAHVTLYGRLVSSLDGSSFDAAELFDLPAGGLHVVAKSAVDASYLVAADDTGGGPACAAAGEPAPCLVPRLSALAHQLLQTTGELASTLSGSLKLVSDGAQSGPEVHWGPAAFLVCAALCVASLGIVAVVLARRLARTALGRIRVAARRARRALRGDATLDPARRAVDALVDRARRLDATRRSCEQKLAGIDRGALDRQAAACDRSGVPGSSAALASLQAEQEEVATLERARASAMLELGRIESTLRVVALRSRGSRVRDDRRARVDLVDALVAELDLRDQAIAEADAT